MLEPVRNVHQECSCHDNYKLKSLRQNCELGKKNLTTCVSNRREREPWFTVTHLGSRGREGTLQSRQLPQFSRNNSFKKPWAPCLTLPSPGNALWWSLDPGRAPTLERESLVQQRCSVREEPTLVLDSWIFSFRSQNRELWFTRLSPVHLVNLNQSSGPDNCGRI